MDLYFGCAVCMLRAVSTREESGAVGSMIGGAWRFALVSIGGFGPWAFDTYLLPKGANEALLYVACLVFFIVFAELFLTPLVKAPVAFKLFNRAFVPAFVAYAVVWSAFWFAFKFGRGEWLGLAAGCAAFALILGKMLAAKGGYLKAIAVLIIAHAVGYFLGSYIFSMRRHAPGFMANWPKKDIFIAAKLAWGLFYGLGFGAGIGYAFHVFQPRKAPAKEA